MIYTVKQLARISGVSVRTLHYYDSIGLLKPALVQENGYRSYGTKELLRLQQIQFFKELEFPLKKIVSILSSPGYNVQQALADQRTFLVLKRARLDSMVHTIDTLLKGGDTTMSDTTKDTMKELEEFKEEARQRWGTTDAYRQSVERTRNWTKEDHRKAAEGWKLFNRQLADTMDKGYDSPEFQALIGLQYEKVNTFYDCSVEMFRQLGEMYASDPKFRATYDSFKPGLADCMRKAVQFYCDARS